MPRYIWGIFAVLMVAVGTALYLMGYRWYDHGATGVGALLVLIVMGTILTNHRSGRRR